MAEKQGTKLCKHCKTEIPKGAKVCPNCRKKQVGALKWVIIGVIAIGIIGAASSGGEKKNNEITKVDSSGNVTSQQESENSNIPSSNEPEEELVFDVGETADFKNVQVTMTNVTESFGSDYNKPADGNVFVLVEFEIANNSDKELAISSMLSFDAYQDGYSTSLSFSALMEKSGEQLDGSIAPGKKMKGSIGYEIPKDYNELEINLQLDVWSSEKIVFLYEK